MVSLCLVFFSYFIFLFSQQNQKHLRILLVLLKVQLKERLPGHHLKIILIDSLFAIGLLQVIWAGMEEVSHGLGWDLTCSNSHPILWAEAVHVAKPSVQGREMDSILLVQRVTESLGAGHV